MKLPELAESASPEFTDAETCKRWLGHVPLANVGAAQREIATQLAEFNRFPTASTQRLAVLEALREAVSFVQIEQARRFSNRALPMSEAESAAFTATIGLWDEMRAGYERCLDAALNRDAGMRAQAALICQRLLAYVGLRMFHHYRAYRQVPPGDWQSLHGTYAAAEKLDVAEDTVKDFLNRDAQDSSPRIAYVRAVLMGMCSPNELGQRQLTFVAYLLERWASKLEVVARAVDEGEGVPPLVADLESDACPERGAAEGAREPRYLDARKLAKSLRNRVALLRKGESPAKLALGEDCVQPACEQLLVQLYRQWCAAKTQRIPERRAGGPAAELCSELPAISHYISGRVFRTPGEQPSELTQRQREEIATFGRVSTRTEEDYSGDHGYAIEKWQMVDQSAQGLRLVRPAAQGGKRLAHGQLVGVRPADGKQFMLAQVRWLMAMGSGDLHVGVKLIPGMPTALAVRPTGLNAQQESWTPALALSASPALNSPASLVLVSGLYKPKRVIEIHAEASSRVRLTEVLERGADFERVAYEPAP
jgi:cyclic-di-GMP-binding protein